MLKQLNASIRLHQKHCCEYLSLITTFFIVVVVEKTASMIDTPSFYLASLLWINFLFFSDEMISRHENGVTDSIILSGRFNIKCIIKVT